jgi:restriction system protein
MPEVLVIALIVLVFIGWLLFVAVGAVSDAITGVSIDMRKLLTEQRKKRFQQKKQLLAQRIRVILPNDLPRAERIVSRLQTDFERCRTETIWTSLRPTWEKKPFLRQLFSPQTADWKGMDIADIDFILRPDPVMWSEKESAILAQTGIYPPSPPVSDCLKFDELRVPPLMVEKAAFEVDHDRVKKVDLHRFFRLERLSVEEYNQKRSVLISRYDDLKRQIEVWNTEERERWRRYIKTSTEIAQEELAKYQSHAQAYSRECNKQKQNISTILEGYKRSQREQVIARVQCILGTLAMPNSVPRSWDLEFDNDQRILIVELALPDVVHRPPIKIVSLKSGPVEKSLNQTERKEFIPKIHPAILLRLAFELFRNDVSDTIKLLVLNGWVTFNDPATGINTKAYTSSLMVERHQVASLNLRNIDPVAAFNSLNGKSAGKLIEIIPIEPTLNLKRTDSRFVEAKAILNTLDGTTNLAAMDWQDFEHLIRELFEKEFAGRGAEVKITQASRDRGVDAIAFNPDPIHGGKYIIQAKRYTNTVDVSAVRDLCAVVRKEGASRGILVTTSTYGADAYAFANNEPVTLLNGAELLGLLGKHGYSFRINLAEARRLKSTQGQPSIEPGQPLW